MPQSTADPVTDVDGFLTQVRAELDRARKRFAPFNSAHEGYAVVLKELDEAWAEIKANDIGRAAKEMVQVAAMALRFLVDLHPQGGGGG